MTLQKNDTLYFPFLDKLGTKSFFILLFLFQIAFIFQGLDFGDEGFHSTFYQRIFGDPNSVDYSFMYWMSGIVGGTWLRLFPEYGLLGLRIGGVLANMFAIIITYNLLKNYLRVNYLKMGLLLLVLLNGAAVKDLSYNNISALFFLGSAVFLFRGLKDNNGLKLFASGVLLTLAVFSRLANAPALALIGVIVYAGFFVYPQKIGVQVRQILLFSGGFIFTVLVLLGIMKMTGQFDPFMDSLRTLRTLGASKESTHHLPRLIKLLVHDYLIAIFKKTLPLVLIVFGGAALINYFRDTRISKGIPVAFSILYLGLLAAMVFLNGTLSFWIFILMIFAAISILSTLFIITNSGNSELKIISLTGTIITFALVGGSDYGIAAAGNTALWISLPIALDYFMGITYLSSESTVVLAQGPAIPNVSEEFSLWITDHQLRRVWQWGAYTCIVLLLLHSFFYTYNDNPNRFKMTYPVHNAFLKGVMTTRERATAINELLQESERYIQKQDYVLTYDDLPMFFTLTHTRPFLKSTWPRLYGGSLLTDQLRAALEEKRRLPVVVYQKVQTLPGPYWPDLNQDNTSCDLDNPKNLAIKQFLDSNHYQPVWENIAFRIYTADRK